LIYRRIKSTADQDIMQEDLNKLSNWAKTWGMEYNPTKCNILSIKRGRSKLHKVYSLEGHPLDHVSNAKYLGVTIRDDTKWNLHINNISAKASKTLGFLHRNLSNCPRQLKITSYFALVRPLLEYSASVWDPHLKCDIKKLEAIQRRSARFVLNQRKRDHTSITLALQNLKWLELQERRRHQRLTMLYKIINGMVAVPALDYFSFSTSKTRSKNSLKINTLQSRTDAYKFSFFPRTICEWNNLSDTVVTSPSVDAFKSRLLTQI
jgi:hypothetical protein